MILTLVIGNTSIYVRAVEDGQKVGGFRLSSDKSRTADEYAALLSILAERNGAVLSDCTGAIIASVVPHLTGMLSEAVFRCIGQRPLVVGPGVKSGLNIRMDDPTELGGDLVAAAVAAAARYPLPCIVIHMGTATAVGVLDAAGCYIGGMLCPGVSLGSSSLTQRTSQLPDISLDPPRHIIGKNTRDSMRSGIVYGAAAMLDGIIARIEEELGEKASVVVTGENADVILPYCRTPNLYDDDELLMHGLWSIYCRNREKR